MTFHSDIFSNCIREVVPSVRNGFVKQVFFFLISFVKKRLFMSFHTKYSNNVNLTQNP